MSKKKRTGNLIVLLVVLAALIAAYFIVSAVIAKNNAAEEVTPKEKIYLYRESDTPLEIFTYNAAEENVSESLVQKNEKYYLADNDRYPLNQSKVKEMMQYVTALEATSKLAGASASADREKYGFDKPNYTMKIVFAPDESATRTYEVTFGAFNSFSGEYYAFLNGSEDVYTVDAGVTSYFENSRRDLLAAEVLDDLSADSVTAVLVTKDGVTNEITDTAGKAALIPQYSTLKKATVLDPVPDDAARASYGLDGSCSVTYRYTETIHVEDEDTKEAKDIEREGEITVLFGTECDCNAYGEADGENDGIAVSFDGFEYLYCADKEAVDTILSYIDYVPAPEAETTSADKEAE